ncbi:oxidoreductase [Dermatobacter hominis]|uniref:oxidoreductase n=1 Tax=Dermatobacter hominis TaxID=2884263 RepID=UPI001D117DF8|nr:oxidoreductase [Dermatobacter hominis]UDY37308.1 SDR family NAD(P)-dependent oxidoreductase [Dermatobacter hominis]
MSRWTESDIPDQTGRTVLVTGANSGLGLETARALAAHGARVLMTARDEGKGRAAIDQVRGTVRDADLELLLLDLADLDDVRRVADGLEGPLDVLVNNAGVMMPPRSLSPQGHELQFATNHLGHFALTGLLLDRLVAASNAGADARVVTVSSTMHRPGRIHYDDLTGERGYSPTGWYSQSKFANVLFGLELDRRLRAAGSSIRSLVAHPGYAATKLQTSGPTGIMKSLMAVGNRVMAQSAEAGARSELYAATDPAAQGGTFIGPDGLGQNRGHPKVVRPVGRAEDPDDARRLWELSEELTGVHFDLPAA